MRKYNGAISLFMVVILLSSFIFGGVFIDASRIVVAKNKVKNAMNTSLRSSMSYYDKALVGDYGLYAYNGDDAKANFDRYFAMNMITKDENLKMFDYKIANTSVTNDTVITDPTEFERQVVEYAKYKAPVTTTMLLIDKIMSTRVFNNMQKNSEAIDGATDALDEFKEQYKKDANQIKVGLSSAKTEAVSQLEAAVSESADKLKESTSGIGDLRQKINEQFGNITSAIDTSKVTMDKMKNDTQEYKESAASDIAKIESGAEGIRDGETVGDGIKDGEYPTVKQDKDIAEQANAQTGDGGTLRTAVANLQTNVQRIKGEVDRLVNTLQTTSEKLVQAKNKLEQDKQAVTAKKNTLDDKSRVLENTYQTWSAYSNAQQSYNTNAENAKKYQQKINDAIATYADNAAYVQAIDLYTDPALSEDYDARNPKTSADQIRQALRKQYSAIGEVFDWIDAYETCIQNRDTAANAMNSANGATLKSAYQTATVQKEQAQVDYANAMETKNRQQELVNSLDREIDALNNQIQAKLNELSGLSVPTASELNVADLAKDKISEALKIIDPLTKVDIITYLQGLYRELNKDMQHYSVGEKEADDTQSKLDDGLIKKVKALCQYAQEMFGTFTDAEKLRNNTYMVDYIMDKCTYLTSQTTRNHYFEKGEVEYIIFGNRSQAANLTASITTMTLMRFAINFIDYFVTGPGDLVAKALYALGRGAARTALDMREMLMSNVGEGVGLCPSFQSLKLTYSDHLRLLLFFKFSQAQEGLKDTIYTNMEHTLSGANLNQLYTRMTAEVEVEVNMLVLPIFVGKFTGANFRDGNYVIKDKATLGY